MRNCEMQNYQLPVHFMAFNVVVLEIKTKGIYMCEKVELTDA